MRIIGAYLICLVACVVVWAGCYSNPLRCAMEDRVTEEHTKPKLLASMERLPSNRVGDSPRVDFAMWDSGDVVWWSTLVNGYCHYALQAGEMLEVRDRINGLRLAQLDASSFTVPDSEYIEITLSPFGQARSYAWDELPSTIQSTASDGESWARAWVEARRSLGMLRPCCGSRVDADSSVGKLIVDTFPGVHVREK